MNTTPSQSSTNGKFDVVNCLFNAGMYYYNGLIDYQTGQPLMTRKNGRLEPKTYFKYHLKYVEDPNYQGLKTEMDAFVRVIKTNAQNNSMKRVLLYRNHNKGETLKDVENLQVMQIAFRNNQVMNYTINPAVPDDYRVQFEALVSFIKTELQ